jgi:peptidyl-prolyl cis-trans isomerase D
MKLTPFEELKRDLSFRKFGFRQIGATVILAMIVLVFVFFGYSAQDSLGGGFVLQINGVLVSPLEYERESARIEQMYSSLLKQFGGAGGQQRDFIKSQVVENLVNQEISYQAAKKLGIHISSNEIVKAITQDFSVFQENGRFQRERYEGLLRANKWSPHDFEKNIRKEKTVTRLRHLAEFALLPSDFELKKEQTLTEKQKNLEYISWDLAQWSQKVQVTSSELESFLKDPQVQEKVQKEFELKKETLGQKEQVRARHILVKIEGDSLEAQEKALAQIKKIQGLLTSSQSFASVAQKYSEDEGSKAKGGDLDFFAKGAMVPEFEEYAFSAPLKKMSEPIKSQFGYHLIEVTDKKPARPAELKDHEKSLAKELWARDQYDIQLKSLEEALSAKDFSKVESIIQKWGMKWEETGFFTLADDQAGSLQSSVAVEKAWELSSDKPYLAQLVRDGGYVYLMRFKAEQNQSKKEGDSGAVTGRSLAQAKSGELLGRYFQEYRKNSKVIQNSQIIKD